MGGLRSQTGTKPEVTVAGVHIHGHVHCTIVIVTSLKPSATNKSVSKNNTCIPVKFFSDRDRERRYNVGETGGGWPV